VQSPKQKQQLQKVKKEKKKRKKETGTVIYVQFVLPTFCSRLPHQSFQIRKKRKKSMRHLILR